MPATHPPRTFSVPLAPAAAGSADEATGTAIDATRCPICGTANVCAMEIERETGLAQPSCWCMSASFTDSLKAQVPEALRGRACICAACAAAAEAADAAAARI